MFLRRSSQSYPRVVISCLASLRQQLEIKYSAAFQLEVDGRLPSTGPLLSIKYPALRRAYLQTSLEPTYSRLHVKELDECSNLLENLRAELLCNVYACYHACISD